MPDIVAARSGSIQDITDQGSSRFDSGLTVVHGHDIAASGGDDVVVEIRDGIVREYREDDLAIVAAGAGNVNVGTHKWAVGFVTADQETGPGLGWTEFAVAVEAKKVHITLPLVADLDPRVTNWTLYRTKANANVFYYLDGGALEQLDGETVYEDNLADGGLVTLAPLINRTGDLLRTIVVADGAPVINGPTSAGYAAPHGARVQLLEGTSADVTLFGSGHP